MVHLPFDCPAQSRAWPVEVTSRDVQFVAGARFKLGELTVAITHCLSMDRLVVCDPVSGETRVVTRVELKPMHQPGTMEDADSPLQLEVSEEDFERAAARHKALQPYIATGVLSTREAHQLAKELCASIRTIRRWIQRYRQRGDITAFIDRPPGPQQGQRTLPREVEAIIRSAVTEKLQSSGNCSVRSVYSAISGDCEAIGQPTPADSTVLARIKDLKADPQFLPPGVGKLMRDRKRLVRGSAGLPARWDALRSITHWSIRTLSMPSMENRLAARG
jgi:Helix-turn-helix domain